jgi:hypothetical protein
MISCWYRQRGRNFDGDLKLFIYGADLGSRAGVGSRAWLRRRGVVNRRTVPVRHDIRRTQRLLCQIAPSQLLTAGIYVLRWDVLVKLIS